MDDDRELLRRYAQHGSQAAFTAFVNRHMNLVYAAALRRVEYDASLAQDVAQRVFAQVARKATRLQSHPALSAWLHQCTRYAALDARRAKLRREQHESTSNLAPDMPIAPKPEISWTELSPWIDAILDRLGERDRSAIIMRFFEDQSFAQIGAKLRISEDAARMRVTRCLEKIRSLLAQRGVVSSVTALSTALTSGMAATAPAGLAITISEAAIAHGTAASSTAAAGTALLTMTKTQAAIMGALIACGCGAVYFQVQHNADLERELAGLRSANQQPVFARETGSLAAVTSALSSGDQSLTDELDRLQVRIAELRARPDGVVDAEIRPRSTWTNAGHATPEAALETFLWAATNRDFEILAESYVLGDRTKAEANQFFTRLPPNVQTRYSTPERLLAPYMVSAPTKQEVDAMQPIEVMEGDHPDERVIRYWVHMADGSGHIDTLPFRYVNNGWRMGSRQAGLSVVDAVDYVRTHVDPDLGSR